MSFEMSLLAVSQQKISNQLWYTLWALIMIMDSISLLLMNGGSDVSVF